MIQNQFPWWNIKKKYLKFCWPPNSTSIIQTRSIDKITSLTNWIINHYSSFREYLDCSEHVTRRTCGHETGTFIRGFLKKMSNTLEKDYCDEYYQKGVNQCPNILSSAVSLGSISNVVKALLLPLLIVFVNWR